MEHLPVEFTEKTRQLMGEERFGRFIRSFGEQPPVSIRLNPFKAAGLTVVDGQPVPWCRHAFYLSSRPNFTMDPLLHAGCFYVQEASSMFLDEVLRQLSIANCKLAVDMCAAPGGKSTLMRTALPEECMLYSNEPVRQRASILFENVSKWGYANHKVTSCYPRDYRKSGMTSDLILCDVPCSGEGMFRKDPATIREWSPQQVEKCWRLQRDIVSDAWACLRPGGIFIYSTCTFNTEENEENIRWLIETYDAEPLNIATNPEWNIMGSLLEGFTAPVYRFIPGISQGEGLFLCVLRKRGGHEIMNEKRGMRNELKCFSTEKPFPSHSSLAALQEVPAYELTYSEAIAYLRGEVLMLPPGTPRGIVDVAFMGHVLGQVKNIGTRANNLYPKPWRIKTTHIPNDYETILRHT